MIRSGRRPADRSEQMILNNHAAMRFVQENIRKPLTPDLVFTLHRIVTDATLDDAGKAGRFRESSDNVVVEDGMGTVLHVPPPAEQLPDRLDAMCRFANEDMTAAILHPVVRAIILHFLDGLRSSVRGWECSHGPCVVLLVDAVNKGIG
jgi:Fic family protein